MGSPAAFIGAGVRAPARLTLRPTDLVVLLVVVGFVLPVASDLLRVGDRRAIAVLAICWACAALKRLMAWRNGQRGQRELFQHGGVEGATSLIVLAGVAPWIVLPLLQQCYPHAWIWIPMSLPIWLRAGGGVLMLCGVMKPFLAALGRDRPDTGTMTMHSPAGRSITPDMLMDGLGFALLAASPLLGALLAGCLALTSINRRLAE
jgi:hypothetical protein